MNTNTIHKHLLENNVKPLTKRVLIYQYLITHRNHPTVETIYKDLLPVVPTLSKTTIYNTLNLFLERNLVQPICTDGNQMRYDADIKPHGHFKCTMCGEVYDFIVPEEEYPAVPLRGFIARQRHYNVTGECANCIASSQN